MKSQKTDLNYQNVKPKICIISEYAYPLLANVKDCIEQETNQVGGAELQMVLLAKELAKRSFHVSFITMNNPKIIETIIDNIHVISPFNLQFGGYTYFNPKYFLKILQALKKSDADIFVQRAASPLTGIIAFYAKFKGKKFFFCVSSDANVSTHLSIRHFREISKIVFRFGIKHSNEIICQTIEQKKLLKLNLGRDGVIIKNAYIPPKNCERKIQGQQNILWIGRITKLKQPEIFLNLAKRLPNLKFQMIAAPSVGFFDYYDYIKKIAENIPNLEFKGFLPHDQIDSIFSETMIFVNTSSSEGFPNTFLEAWGNNTPVISLHFDPDHIIVKEGLGLIANNFDELKEFVQKIHNDRFLRVSMGRSGRKYVEREHNINSIIEKYEQLICWFR